MVNLVQIRPQLWGCVMKRLFSTVIKPNQSLESVKMAYASYEMTSTSVAPTPLIVMHGLFGSKANWNSLCKVYQKNTNPSRKVFAVDARNHGDSPHSNNHTYPHLAEDIKALYREQQISKACLMGHSMGGRAVMYFALTNPDLVEKLIIADISPIGASPTLKAIPALFNIMLRVKMPKTGSMSSAKSEIDKQLSRRIEDKGLRAFIMTNIVADTNGGYRWRINLPALVKNFHNVSSFPTSNSLMFEGPVLFVGGANSDYLPKEDHSEILKMFPNAKFIYIDGAGHWLHSEKPNEFLKVTLDFLNGI